MTYLTAIQSLTNLVNSYREIRRRGIPDELQELRDRISEDLFDFGPTYADIRSAAEKAEANYKTCLKESTFKERTGTKTTVADAETKAFLDCKELHDEWNNKKHDFYLAKSLLERTEQILNSLSSRIKLLKHG